MTKQSFARFTFIPYRKNESHINCNNKSFENFYRTLYTMDFFLWSLYVTRRICSKKVSYNVQTTAISIWTEISAHNKLSRDHYALLFKVSVLRGNFLGCFVRFSRFHWELCLKESHPEGWTSTTEIFFELNLQYGAREEWTEEETILEPKINMGVTIIRSIYLKVKSSASHTLTSEQTALHI